MKKPRPPKPPRPQKSILNPPQNLVSKQGPLARSDALWVVLKTWWGKAAAVFALVGSFQVIFTSYGFFIGLYKDTIPEITSIGPNNNPFTLPFNVKNNSKYFSMGDVKWQCGIDHVIAPEGGGFSNLSILRDEPSRFIAPEKSSNFDCPISAKSDVTAKINPIISYKTFWIDRIFSSRNFTWYAKSVPPRWIESE